MLNQSPISETKPETRSKAILRSAKASRYCPIRRRSDALRCESCVIATVLRLHLVAQPLRSPPALLQPKARVNAILSQDGTSAVSRRHECLYVTWAGENQSSGQG